MGIKKIYFSDIDHGLGQLGGGAWLSDLSLWPSDPETGALMLPLMTLTPSFLDTSFITQDMVLSVFISVQRTSDGFKRSSLRKFTVNQQTELKALNEGYSRVIVHKKASQELIPDPMADLIERKYIQLKVFDETDLAEELQDEDNGAAMSKVLGRPYWLQDPIYESPRYFFAAQVQELDIRGISPKHDGLFADGTGYLFIDNRAKKLTETAEAGYFFIQFT